MNITATFIGANSLGYEKGKKYDLKLDGSTICRLDGTGKCPYQSIRAFLSNWYNIEVYQNTYTHVYPKDLQSTV
jgi:hypothetical protein